MDFIGSILGWGGRSRGGDGITGIVKGVSRWIIGCGCTLVLLVILGIFLIIFGFVALSDRQITLIMVFGTMLVAIVSLIRTSMNY